MQTTVGQMETGARKGGEMSEIVRERRGVSSIRVEDGLAFVDLGYGYEAKIDAEDQDLVKEMRWCLNKAQNNRFYAISHKTRSRPYILMHRLILAPPARLQVDHVDNDGLNNCRINLRQCTQSQNMANKTHDSRNLLGVKGVSLRLDGFYRAKIEADGKKFELGNFPTVEEASAAYIGAARVLFGKFARR